MTTPPRSRALRFAPGAFVRTRSLGRADSTSSIFSLGFLVLAGFIAGIFSGNCLQYGSELTNTERFAPRATKCAPTCLRLKTTVHYNHRSGVRAHCPDCHVPHEWTDKIARKMQASKEVWGKLFGTINTREKFLDHRLSSRNMNGRA
jgi:cytochrome c-type protein NapC